MVERRSSHHRGSKVAVLLIAVLTIAAVPAFASRGNGGGGKPSRGGSDPNSTLSWRMVFDANANQSPNFGDTITFDIFTTATKVPEVKAACTQYGAPVYYHSGGWYPEDPWAPGDQMFQLSSGAWTGGGAECVATLYYMNWKGQEVDLKTLPFSVGV